MNHSFIGRQIGDTTLCAKCKYPEDAHSSDAECEACSRIGPCEIIDDILLCIECQIVEGNIESVEMIVPNAIEDVMIQDAPTINLTNELISGNITKHQELFNAKIISLVDLEAIINSSDIENKQFELARVASERLTHLKQVLWTAREQEMNATAEIHAIQVRLNQLAGKLRADEREKLALEHIEYKPTEPKIAKTRLSKEDKLAEHYAKLMKIPIEQAKRLIAASVKEVVKCSCSETPGLCRVHGK